MDSAFKLHITEITDQLNSIVIKFSPFVEIFNNNATYLAVPGYDEDNAKTFPYYRILAGDAAFASQSIYAFSPLLKEEVLLTRENVLANSDIITFYRNQNNLKLLLTRYPDDQFLIRRILNPVKDIDAAISASNLTILETQYSEILFNQYEYSDLMIFMQDILWKIDYRWYMSPLENEDLYPYAFYAMIWNILPMLMLTRRILNIKTISVHPFHIWEYLTSLGFGAYKGYLSHDQELFLYRNARYLKFHAGKKFLLDILESVFLTPLRYGLTKKVIIDHTTGREDTHDKYPEVVPSTGAVDDYLSSTNFDSFLQDIYSGGHDVRDSTTYRQDITNLFSKSSTNKLNTKFLEFDRNIDMSEMMLLIKFILDSVAYLITQNKLLFAVEVTSPVTQNTIRFNNATDALSLLFYCMYMQEEIPTIPFKKHTSTTAFLCTGPPTIPKTIYVNKSKYYIKSYVNVADFLTNLPYVTDDIYSSKDLSTILGEQYVWLFGLINTLGTLSDTVEHEAHVAVFRQLIPELKVLDIDQPYTSYEEFFETYPIALNEINKINDSSQYGEFMYAIISGICPLEYGFAALARDDEIISILIEKIKELFMYMVSYNITFLNKVFEQSENIELPKITMHLDVGVEGQGVGELPGGSDPHNYDEIIGSVFALDDQYSSMNYFISITPEIVDTINTNFDIDVECIEMTSFVDISIQQDDSDTFKLEDQFDDIIYATNTDMIVEFINVV